MAASVKTVFGSKVILDPPWIIIKATNSPVGFIWCI